MPVVLSASTLKGDAIKNRNDDKLGDLEEIVIDLDSGRVAYGVLAAGGFLGMGEKFFAIPWDMFTVDTDDHSLVVDLNKEVLDDAPGFDKDNWPLTDDRDHIAEVYDYYRVEPYWVTR